MVTLPLISSTQVFFDEIWYSDYIWFPLNLLQLIHVNPNCYGTTQWYSNSSGFISSTYQWFIEFIFCPCGGGFIEVLEHLR